MGRITQPQQQPLYKFEINSFLGADLTNQQSYISPVRSPDCINMIRESAGKVRKWIGYHTVKAYSGRINGVHTYTDENGDIHLIHSKDALYNGDEKIYTGMKDEKSMSRQLGGKLFIFDGKACLVYHKNKDKKYVTQKAEELAYVPTIFISKPPNGGGVPYEPINLLSSKKIECFLGTDTDKRYQLAATEIYDVNVITKMVDGKEQVLEKNKDYWVNTPLGIVEFTQPHPTQIKGEDNIKITYTKEIEGYKNRVSLCNIVTLYGLNGAKDRLFVAGGGEYLNRDYYSQLNNGLYFGDLWYMVLGGDSSKIMGYSIVNDKLAAHLDRSDDDTNIILREGNLVDGEAAFRLAGGYLGQGAVSSYGFGVLETEPLFLTQSGIYAVTPSDVLGERYGQLRSYYLNGLLLKQDLGEVASVIYDRLYILAAGGYLFALDGTQAARENNEPYSNRQYAGFYRSNVDARCLWVRDNTLFFGTNDGKIKAFYKNYDDVSSFNDDGEAIVAKWTTPEIYGKSFYKKKKFRRLHLLLAAATATGVRISGKYDSIIESIKEYSGEARYFSYKSVIYSKFTYKTDKTAQRVSEKISISPENAKVQFVFENTQVNEPFGLYSAVVEFTQGR